MFSLDELCPREQYPRMWKWLIIKFPSGWGICPPTFGSPEHFHGPIRFKTGQQAIEYFNSYHKCPCGL